MPTTTATLHGRVTYTPGDGAPIPIPARTVELIPGPDSMTLSWTTEGETVAGSAAIPKDQFNQYVRDGKIRIDH